MIDPIITDKIILNAWMNPTTNDVTINPLNDISIKCFDESTMMSQSTH
jgi:hypothetical protein